MLSCKVGADQPNITPGNDVTLSDENGQFKTFSLQDKPSSFIVLHSGWVIYEKPNFKGKCLYAVDGDCFSNDPENKKGPKLKMWQVEIDFYQGEKEICLIFRIQLGQSDI